MPTKKAIRVSTPTSMMSLAVRKSLNPFRKTVHAIVMPYRSKTETEIIGIAQRLVDCVVDEAVPLARTPETTALLRGVAARETLKNREGGHISAEEVASVLAISKVAVLDRYKKGDLIGWRGAQEAVRFPVWQFNEAGLTPSIKSILNIWKDASHLDDWAKVLFFLTPLASLNNRCPLELLRKGQTKLVKNVALAYAD
jgi:hypothetical protein